jgi:hypothetical protein
MNRQFATEWITQGNTLTRPQRCSRRQSGRRPSGKIGSIPRKSRLFLWDRIELATVDERRGPRVPDSSNGCRPNGFIGGQTPYEGGRVSRENESARCNWLVVNTIETARLKPCLPSVTTEIFDPLSRPLSSNSSEEGPRTAPPAPTSGSSNRYGRPLERSLTEASSTSPHLHRTTCGDSPRFNQFLQGCPAGQTTREHPSTRGSRLAYRYPVGDRLAAPGRWR